LFSCVGIFFDDFTHSEGSSYARVSVHHFFNRLERCNRNVVTLSDYWIGNAENELARAVRQVIRTRHQH